MNRRPRDRDALDRGEPPALDPLTHDGGAAPHPVSRPVLRGHVARRHLRPAADPTPRPQA